MIKAVIYDLDGLMVNSEPLHDEAWEIFLAKYGKKLNDIPLQERKKLLGMKVMDITKKTNELLNLGLDPEMILKERSAISHKLLHEKLEAMPGMHESLKLFKSLKLKTAITSSGIKHYIDAVIDKFNFRNDFDVVITGNDVNLGKPNPEPYIKTCLKLGIDPKDCLVLEDADAGVISAKAAGCFCIAVKSKHNSDQSYDQADLIVNSLMDINKEIVSRF